jgi:uncharacterized protein (TIRG00374 family)
VQSKQISSVLKYLLFLAFGLILLWLSFRQLDMAAVWTEIKKAHYSWLFLSLLLVLISHFFRAARWNLLIGGVKYKTRLTSTFFSVMIGYLANTAVPRMGEFVRCGVLSKKENIPFNVLFGTVILERFVDLMVLLLLIVGVIVFQVNLLNDFLHEILGPFARTVFVNILDITLFSVLLLFGLFGAFVLLKKNKHWFNKHPFYLKIRKFFRGVLEGIQTIKTMKNKWLFLIYTFLIWLFYALMVYVPVMMFPQTAKLDFVDGLTLLAIGSLGIVAPVPGGIGAYHFIVKSILTELYHISPDVAISFATITHAGQTILNVSMGSLGYLYILVTKRQKPSNEKS